MARVLVAGCGDIGYQVALALVRQGHQVTALKRRAPLVPAPFPIVSADIRQKSTLSVLPDEFDLVLFVVSAGSRQAEAYQALYDSGLNNLLAHFNNAGRMPRWLMVSSTSVYGQNHAEWVDEESETRPASLSAQCLIKAETRLWELNDSNCVVRFSGIYGPGRDWLLKRAAQGEAVQRQPPFYTNRIHRDDCVAALLFLIQKLVTGEALQRCYLVSDNDPAPLWDVMNWIAEQYGFPLPAPLVKAPESEQNKRCNNARLRALGYRFRFSSYREGYRCETLETKRQRVKVE
ncbi:SDR family oxidoreductase [Methylomonas sp. MgM2]